MGNFIITHEITILRGSVPFMLVNCEFGVDLGLGASRVVVLCRWLSLLPVPLVASLLGVSRGWGVLLLTCGLSARCVWGVRVLPSGLAAGG